MTVSETAKKIRGSISRPIHREEVELTCRAQEAKKIFIAGTFNDGNTKLTPMKKGKDGTWRVKIKLSPGRYEYKYFVDGVWAADFPGADSAPNSFGTYNRVVSVN
jgi:1,4-alpha-glucan branching enzyme